VRDSDAIQTNRLTRNSVTSDCSTNKPCPGEIVSPGGSIHFDAYSFTASAAACVTVSLSTPCNNTSAGNDFIHSSAYLGSYDPANKCLNYLADIGNSPLPSGSYSFVVPSNSVFVVIVNEVDSGVGCTNYTLTVSGFDCVPNLNIARDSSSSSNVVLRWSTSAVGYNLVTTNQVGGPSHAFTPVGPPPVVVNGKFTVTNTISGPTRFYELRKP
jgi:hypothetical protein